MKKVYISGKLNDETIGYIKNMHKMMEYAEKVKKLGFAVFVPCLDVLMGIKFGNYTYKDYADNNMAWVEVSDILFVCPGFETSKGTKAEIKRAMEFGIPVYYSLKELK